MKPTKALGLSLQARLILLVAASVLPLLMLGVIHQYFEYVETRELAGQRVLELTRNMTRAVERELQVSIAALETLTHSRTLASGDFEGFRPTLAAVVAEQWPGGHALVLKENGQQVLNLALPPGEPLPVRQNRKFMDEMFATGKPVVSDLFFGIVVKRPVVSIDVPVKRDDGKIVYSLSLNPSLENFAQVIQDQRLPENWVVSIFDRQGTIIARVPNGNQYLGKKGSANFLTKLFSAPEGLVESISLEGTPLLSAFSHSAKFGWSVGMGLPRSDLTRPAWNAAIQTLVVGAMFLLASLALASIVARRITQPIAVLRRLAASTDSAARLDPPRIGLREADEVAQALRAAEEERRSIQSALQASDAKLHQAQKMEAIGNLTGGMAHDFNNLLGVVIGNLDLLRPQVASSRVASELVGDATEAALKGAALTRSLLAFARKQPLQPETMQPSDVIAGMAKLLSRALGTDIEISLDLASGTWPVIIDRAQFEVSLLNLATNARDAMPNGGRLMIATKNSSLDEDFAASHPDAMPGDYVLIEISDTGIGMPPEVVSHIFEPFFTTKEPGRGTGLGLSMVFGFVKQSGGYINVYSEPGKGSIFCLYLPRAAMEADGSRHIGEGPDLGAGQSVLVVDDNPALLRVSVRQLTELGYSVSEADSAAAALAILESRPVDVLFTDIVMPGAMNGLDLAREVLARWPSVQVIVTSGFPKAMVGGQWEAMHGSVRLLGKPYRRDELARALHEALTSRSAAVLTSGELQ